jgi:hypothetical protein
MSIDPLAMDKMPSNFLQRQAAADNRLADGATFWLTEAAADGRYTRLNGGATADRPLEPLLFEMYFDTDLGLPVWWNGTDWVDATGTAV